MLNRGAWRFFRNIFFRSPTNARGNIRQRGRGQPSCRPSRRITVSRVTCNAVEKGRAG